MSIHVGSDTKEDYGLHIFLRTILYQIDVCEHAIWWEYFRLPPSRMEAGPSSMDEFPETSSLRFGAQRDSTYGSSMATKAGTLAPAMPSSLATKS
jgi:hypothetical protein